VSGAAACTSGDADRFTDKMPIAIMRWFVRDDLFMNATIRAAKNPGKFLMLCVTILGLAVLAMPISARDAFPEAYYVARDAGWAEAVLRLRDPQAFADFAQRVGGWRVEGPIDDEWWIRDQESGVGAIRVLRAPREIDPPKPFSPWDTGGLFSLMTRSNNTDGVYHSALESGWTALNAPVSLDFGGVKLANVVLRGPDALHIAVYERLQPRLPEAIDLQKLRRPFNSMQVVRDLAAARTFYIDTLGFEIIAEGRFKAPPGTPSNFGIPESLAAGSALDYLIVGPSAKGPTQIEVVSFAGLTGRARSVTETSQLGLIALRFPVRSLTRVVSRLERERYPHQSTVRAMPPFGVVRMVRIRSPEAAQLEFFELPSQDGQPQSP